MENGKEIPEVVGSVIQRSIIPKNLSTMLNITTVPIPEAYNNVSSLKELITHIFGITKSDMIDQQEYKRSLQVLSDPKFWNKLEHFYYEFYGSPSKIFIHEWYRWFRRWPEQFWMKEEDKHILGNDVVLCQLSSADIPNMFGHWPSYIFPFPPIPSRHPQEMISEFFSKYEIRSEAMAIAIRVRTTAILSSKKIVSAIDGINQYHIPFGQSPKITSDTLQNIIKSAKSIVVAPLIAGGLGSATFISTGQYLLAIECAAAASASTIILVATTSLADYIVSYISKQRSRIEKQ
jgi:hypothetical protein